MPTKPRLDPSVRANAIKRAGPNIFGTVAHDAKPRNRDPQEIETVGKTRFVLSHLPNPSFTTRPTEPTPTQALRDFPNRLGRGSDLTEPERFSSDLD
jgi:hypothetical protein